jgi:hypothetical protein
MQQIVTALISGLVALLVGGGSALLTIRRERERWLTDLKAAWSLELYKSRLATYPEAQAALAPLSNASAEPVTPQIAQAVGQKLNQWLYSAGGLCADPTTRGALLGLRECCRKWASEGGARPEDFYTWRNLLGTFLRRDLDILGLESYDFDLDPTLLSKLQRELESTRKGQRRNNQPARNK